MSRRAFASITSPARRQGFTLLEMCIVLFIIALMAGAALPSMSSAFTEQALRSDAQQFSLMVKIAMIKSSEQQKPYVISLDGKNLLLEPAVASTADSVPADAPDSAAADAPTSQDVTQTQTLSNTIKFPDAEKKNRWETLPSVKWTFEPAGLCPLPRVRIERGSAYIEMSFNALTGNVEDEALYVP